MSFAEMECCSRTQAQRTVNDEISCLVTVQSYHTSLLVVWHIYPWRPQTHGMEQYLTELEYGLTLKLYTHVEYETKLPDLGCTKTIFMKN